MSAGSEIGKLKPSFGVRSTKMADSDWTTLTGDAAKQQEAEFKAGKGAPPPVGGKKWKVVEDIDPSGPQTFSLTDPITGITTEATATCWDAVRTQTFSLLFRDGVAPPEARPVRQFCNRCSGHTDSLADAGSLAPIGVPVTMKHVGNMKMGDREGNLYLRYRVRGTQLKRTQELTMCVQQGDGPQVVSTQTDEQQKSTKWERKSIDHIEEGLFVRWLTAMSVQDCETGLSEQSFGFHESPAERNLLAVLHESGLDTNAALLNDGGAITEVLAAANELEQPLFLVRWSESEGFELTLSTRSTGSELLSHGTVKVVHGEGFSTLEDWQPAGNRAGK